MSVFIVDQPDSQSFRRKQIMKYRSLAGDRDDVEEMLATTEAAYDNVGEPRVDVLVVRTLDTDAAELIAAGAQPKSRLEISEWINEGTLS